jgi:hypothetical protein
MLRFLQRLFELFRGRASLSTDDVRGTPIPDEFRFARLKSRVDRLATEAWQTQESLNVEFTLDPSTLPAGSPDRVIHAVLNHVRRVAPGLSVPLHVPRVETGSLVDAGGQFKTPDGWARIKLANQLVSDRGAVRAVIAHEVCHYILENSGIRESNVEENEKMTDACMFVCGLSLLFLEGYKRAATEHGSGHRLGYLTDPEYEFASRYVLQLRRDDSLRLVTNADKLQLKLVARIPDKEARERLVRFAQARYPLKTDTEICDLVITDYERDRRKRFVFTIVAQQIGRERREGVFQLVRRSEGSGMKAWDFGSNT